MQDNNIDIIHTKLNVKTSLVRGKFQFYVTNSVTWYLFCKKISHQACDLRLYISVNV